MPRPTKRLFNKIRADAPRIFGSIGLSTVVKVMNDAAGPNILIPSLLSFGIMPRIPYIPHKNMPPYLLLDIRPCLLHAKILRLKLLFKELRQLWLTNQPSRTSSFSPGHAVYVYCEKINCWTGPHLVRLVSRKLVFVDLVERSGALQSSYSPVKSARLPSIQNFLYPQTSPSMLHAATASSRPQNLASSLPAYTADHTACLSTALNSLATPTPSTTSAPPVAQLYCRQESLHIFFTEKISPRDPHCGLFDV